jgi:hypothetical protein
VKKRRKRKTAKRKKPEHPEKYFEAAIQRRKEADFLYRGKGYEPGGIYLLGVAAESLLRAFIYKNDPFATIPKKQQHNLKILANKYFLSSINNPEVYVNVEKANTYLYEVWEIGHRYRNLSRLKRFFKEKRDKLGTTNVKTIYKNALDEFDVLFKVARAKWRNTKRK